MNYKTADSYISKTADSTGSAGPNHPSTLGKILLYTLPLTLPAVLDSVTPDLAAQNLQHRKKPYVTRQQISRQQKINRIHPTTNRILPNEQKDSTGNLEDHISVLTNGMLLQPSSITIDYYGQDVAFDFEKMPMKKQNTYFKVSPRSIDQILKGLKNGVDSYYSTSDKNSVLNGKQLKMNYTQWASDLKRHERIEKAWSDALKDTKITGEEWLSLPQGNYGFLLTAYDKKTNKAVESVYGVFTTGKNLTDYVASSDTLIDEMPWNEATIDTIPWNKPIKKAVNIEAPTTQEQWAYLNGGVGIHLSDGKISPLVTLGTELGNLDLSAYFAWKNGTSATQKERFDGFNGSYTELRKHTENRENIFGFNTLYGSRFKAGLGVEYHDIDEVLKQNFDEVLMDWEGNVDKERINKSLPDQKMSKSYLSAGPRASYRLNDWLETFAGSNYAKGHKPSYIAGVKARIGL